jgi:hypothetical protein
VTFRAAPLTITCQAWKFPKHMNTRKLHPDIYLARRRAHLERVLQHPLVSPRASGLDAERRQFLLEEAEDLYWNELEWEKLTAEEMSRRMAVPLSNSRSQVSSPLSMVCCSRK